MFLEPNFKNNDSHQKMGWIEVICGSMFSGKTEELIRRLNRAKIAKQKVQIFKHAIDKRYNANHVVSHDANAIYSTSVQTAQEIRELAENVDLICIDEVQFFDEQIIEVCIELANSGKRVIVAGLDMDFKGEPFGFMPQLMAIAEFINKLHAVCMQCGEPASYSYRLVSSEEKVLVGQTEIYEARCRRCFYFENKTISIPI